MKVLYIIRHGETEWNVAGRMQGRMDSPLTARGEVQAKRHGEVIHGLEGVDAMYVSSAGRTRHTADLVNASLGVSIAYSDALLERDCGTWQGKTLAEVAEFDQEGIVQRQTNPVDHRPGGGENLADMRARFEPLVAELMQVDRLAVVTHGVMSKVMLGYFLELDGDKTRRVRHPNDLFYRVRFSDGVVAVDFFQQTEAGEVCTVPGLSLHEV